MDEISSEERIFKMELSEKWIQKRERIFIIFLLQRFCLGLEFTMLHTTLWSYVTHGMHSSHSDWFYGIIYAGRYPIPIFLSWFISKWFDTHRRLKLCAISINMAIATGYLLYTIPLSPYFAVTGSLLQGSGFILRFIMNSEIFRFYDKDEISGRLLILMLALGLGEAAGPVFIHLLRNVNFSIGGLHIMYGNMPSIILLMFTVIIIILMYIFLHDISKEHDVRRYHLLSQQSISLDSASTKTTHRAQTSFGIDTIILLLQQFISAFLCSGLSAQLIPLIVETFHYGKVVVQVSYIGTSVCLITTALIIRQMRPSSIGVYNCGILSLLLILVLMVLLLIITTGKYSNVVNYLLLTLFIISYGICWICETTFLIVTIGKMFHSSNQSFVEGIRMVVKLNGELFGTLISVFLYEYFVYCFPPIATIILLLLVAVIVRRETLSDPQVAVKNIS